MQSLFSDPGAAVWRITHRAPPNLFYSKLERLLLCKLESTSSFAVLIRISLAERIINLLLRGALFESAPSAVVSGTCWRTQIS